MGTRTIIKLINKETQQIINEYEIGGVTQMSNIAHADNTYENKLKITEQYKDIFMKKIKIYCCDAKDIHQCSCCLEDRDWVVNLVWKPTPIDFFRDLKETQNKRVQDMIFHYMHLYDMDKETAYNEILYSTKTEIIEDIHDAKIGRENNLFIYYEYLKYLKRYVHIRSNQWIDMYTGDELEICVTCS